MGGPCANASELRSVDYIVESDQEFEYPAAAGSDEDFVGVRKECNTWTCMSESAKINASALPSDWSWSLLTLVRRFSPYGKPIINAYLGELEWFFDPWFLFVIEWELLFLMILMFSYNCLRHCWFSLPC